MSSFKEMILRDLDSVFHRADEMAEEKCFEYDGRQYEADIIIDYDTEDRKILSSDYGEGIYISGVTIYIPEAVFEDAPRKNHRFRMDGEIYYISQVERQMGEYVLHLVMHDE